VLAFARPRCAEGESPREEPNEDGVVPRLGGAERERPSRLSRWRLQGHHRAPAAVDEGVLDPPLLEDIRPAVDRGALADPAEVEAHAVGVRADREAVAVELEGREPGAERDVERPVRPVEERLGGGQALERALADAGALPRGQIVDPRDVAV